MCCEEIWCRKGFEGSNCRPREAIFYFILLLYCVFFIILLFFERDKQRGILMSNVIERDEEVRYINGSGCLLIEICTNKFFFFPNSGINIKEY